MKRLRHQKQTNTGKTPVSHNTPEATKQRVSDEIPAEEQRIREERYKALVALSAQIFWFMNDDGAVIEDIPLWRAYTGQSEDEVKQRGWMNAIHLDDRKQALQAWSHAFATKDRYEVEYRLRRFDGTYHTFLARGMPSLDTSGTIREWSNTCTDLSEQKQFEETQREIEWYFSTTFEQVAVGMAYIGLEGQILHVNQHLCDIFGYTRGELQEQNFQYLNASNDKSEDLAYIRSDAGAKSPPYIREKYFTRKDGSSIWMHLTIAPISKPSGKLSHFVVFLQDISQPRDTEERLQKSVQELQMRTSYLEAIFESMIDNVFIYDTKGNLTRLNNAVREYAPKEGLSTNYNSRSMSERTTEYAMRDEHGHLLEEDQLPMKRILRGEVLKGSSAVDIIFRQPSGQDQQVSMSGTPIRDRSGQIIGALCISRDVTERRKLERRTHEALDALVAMAETLVQTPPTTETADSPVFSSATYLVIQRIVELTQRVIGCQRVGILAVDAEIPTIHPMATLGFSAEQEQRWFMMVSGTSSRLTDLLLDSAIQARLQANETLLLDMTQPSFKQISTILGVRSILLAPICAENGLIGVLYADHGNAEHTYTPEEISLIEAMTKLSALAIERERRATELAKLLSVLQKTNAQLEQVNRLQSDFITIVSHEFRTTLTGIQGFSELLRDEDFSTNEVKEYADDINMDAKRLTRMISELLDLERMKLGKMTLHQELVDFNAILQNIAERTNMTATRHTIRLKLDKAIPPIEGDLDKLTQVVSNLMTNAVKYSPTGGEILLASALEGSFVHVQVQDQGLGIPEDALEQVFVPYSRVESGKTRYIEGTGLGLPIVRQIIQMHGGHVWVESKLGDGSTFHATLPLIQNLERSQKVLKTS